MRGQQSAPPSWVSASSLLDGCYAAREDKPDFTMATANPTSACPCPVFRLIVQADSLRPKKQHSGSASSTSSQIETKGMHCGVTAYFDTGTWGYSVAPDEVPTCPTRTRRRQRKAARCLRELQDCQGSVTQALHSGPPVSSGAGAISRSYSYGRHQTWRWEVKHLPPPLGRRALDNRLQGSRLIRCGVVQNYPARLRRLLHRERGVRPKKALRSFAVAPHRKKVLGSAPLRCTPCRRAGWPHARCGLHSRRCAVEPLRRAAREREVLVRSLAVAPVAPLRCCCRMCCRTRLLTPLRC